MVPFDFLRKPLENLRLIVRVICRYLVTLNNPLPEQAVRTKSGRTIIPYVNLTPNAQVVDKGVSARSGQEIEHWTSKHSPEARFAATDNGQPTKIPCVQQTRHFENPALMIQNNRRFTQLHTQNFSSLQNSLHQRSHPQFTCDGEGLVLQLDGSRAIRFAYLIQIQQHLRVAGAGPRSLPFRSDCAAEG